VIVTDILWETEKGERKKGFYMDGFLAVDRGK